MVEVDPSWNGVEVLVYLLRNDPFLWGIIGLGLVVFLISIIVDNVHGNATYSSHITNNIDQQF
jgi:hypothetical protein